MISHQTQSTFRSNWLQLSVLISLAGISLFLRTHFLYDQVFREGYVNFHETDPWYHVRAVEHLVHHFPHRLGFDPYALHPTGQFVPVGPLLDLILATIAILLGWGSPSISLIHGVCAWFPAIIGALIPIPMYLLGRTVRDETTGLMGAAIIAVLPGAFFRRSVLGYTDHHVLECFFSLWVILFLIRMCDRTGVAALTDDQAKDRVMEWHWVGEATLMGVALGAYLLTWVGGSLLVLLVFVAIVLQALVGGLANRAAERISYGAAWAFVVALAMVLPFHEAPGFTYHIASLGGGAAYLLFAGVLVNNARYRKKGRGWLFGALVILSVGGSAAFRLVAPFVYRGVVSDVRSFFDGTVGEQVVAEAISLLQRGGVMTLGPAWEMFNVGMITTILAVPVILLDSRGRGSAHLVILIVWVAFAIIGSVVQKRFAYYLALNVALFSACFWSFLFGWFLSRRPSNHVGLRRVVALVVFSLVALAPSLPQTLLIADEHDGPNADWHESLTWLRQQSPQPFSDDSSYYQSYGTSTSDRPYVPPSSSYGVLTWWDYGYWVTQIAHRVPTANPTQSGAAEAARFFVAQDEAAGATVMDRVQARYVMIDADLPVWEDASTDQLAGKFHALIRWAGHDPKQFFEKYLLPRDEGWFDLVVVYYPAYYRSMLARLYFFNGQGQVPHDATVAIRYSQVSENGVVAKRIDETLRFDTYESAEQFVGRQTQARWAIVGASPGQSCVPLEPLKHFRVVHKSPGAVSKTPEGDLPYVSIFEYLQEDSAKGPARPREAAK